MRIYRYESKNVNSLKCTKYALLVFNNYSILIFWRAFFHHGAHNTIVDLRSDACALQSERCQVWRHVKQKTIRRYAERLAQVDYFFNGGCSALIDTIQALAIYRAFQHFRQSCDSGHTGFYSLPLKPNRYVVFHATIIAQVSRMSTSRQHAGLRDFIFYAFRACCNRLSIHPVIKTISVAHQMGKTPYFLPKYWQLQIAVAHILTVLQGFLLVVNSARSGGLHNA